MRSFDAQSRELGRLALNIRQTIVSLDSVSPQIRQKPPGNDGVWIAGVLEYVGQVCMNPRFSGPAFNRFQSLQRKMECAVIGSADRTPQAGGVGRLCCDSSRGSASRPVQEFFCSHESGTIDRQKRGEMRGAIAITRRCHSIRRVTISSTGNAERTLNTINESPASGSRSNSRRAPPGKRSSVTANISTRHDLMSAGVNDSGPAIDVSGGTCADWASSI